MKLSETSEFEKVIQQLRSEFSKKQLQTETILDLAKQLAIEIDKNSSPILKNAQVTQTTGMMDRILLHKDDLVEVRAHLFLEDATETYIHDHRQGFISTCLQGGYIHKIWTLLDGTKSYKKYFRENSGVNSDEFQKIQGDLMDVLCYHFERGQSFYLSQYGYHTVVPVRKKRENREQLITLTIRNLKDKRKVSTILSESDFSEEQNSTVINVCGDEEDKVKERFLKALQDYVKSKDSSQIPRSYFETESYEKRLCQLMEETIRNTMKKIGDEKIQEKELQTKGYCMLLGKSMNDLLKYFLANENKLQDGIRVPDYGGKLIRSQIQTLCQYIELPDFSDQLKNLKTHKDCVTNTLFSLKVQHGTECMLCFHSNCNPWEAVDPKYMWKTAENRTLLRQHCPKYKNMLSLEKIQNELIPVKIAPMVDLGP